MARRPDEKIPVKMLSVLALTVACLLGGGCASLEKRLDKPFTATFTSGDSIVAQFTIGKAGNALGVAADTKNQAPEGPAAIATSPKKDVFVLDTLNHRIMMVQPSGKQRAIIDVPQALYGVDLVVTDDFFYVLDSQGQQVLKLDREGKVVATFAIDPAVSLAGSVTLTVLPGDDIRIRTHGAEEVKIGKTRDLGEPTSSELATATAQGPVETRFDRNTDNQARLVLTGKTRDLNAPTELKLESKEFLASVELLAVDEEGRYYVLAEELTSGAPETAVHTAIVRYAKDGKLDAVADLPLQDTVFVPNRFVTITADGKAYFLQPGQEDVKVVELTFVKRDSLSTGRPEATPAATRGLAPELEDDAFEETIRKLNADDPVPATRALGISRRQIIANAERYLFYKWRLKPENYQHKNDKGTCSPPGSLWKRPTRLNGMVGKEIQALPYKWGGFQSLTQFQNFLNEGYLAGDVCTCRTDKYGYCVTKDSTGVDCSGFVSRVLEEKYYTTSNLKKIADPLPGFRSLRPGDILNRAGNHVRLFVGFAEDGPLTLKTIESAVSCGGICAATYRVSQLQKYVPMRYRKVQE